MHVPKSVQIIANPTAGSADDEFVSAIAGRLQSSGWQVSLKHTSGPNMAGAIARNSTDDIIAIAGGDGTIREVINGLAGEKRLLALIPTGTANVLAAEIGLHKSVDAVVSTMTDGVAMEFYMGHAGNTYFSCMASIGFDADVVSKVSVALKKRIGRYAYVWAAMRRLVSYHPARMTIDIDGHSHRCHWALVLNSRYYAGLYTCMPEASISDDKLYVCLLQAGTRVAVLRFALELMLGRLKNSSRTRMVPGKHIQVQTPDRLIQADGDIIGVTPLLIASVPSGGLQILTPPCPREDRSILHA